MKCELPVPEFAYIFQCLCRSQLSLYQSTFIFCHKGLKEAPSHTIGPCSLTHQSPKTWYAFWGPSSSAFSYTNHLLWLFLHFLYQKTASILLSLLSFLPKFSFKQNPIHSFTLLFNYCDDNAILHPKSQWLPLKTIYSGSTGSSALGCSLSSGLLHISLILFGPAETQACSPCGDRQEYNRTCGNIPCLWWSWPRTGTLSLLPHSIGQRKFHGRTWHQANGKKLYF